MTNDKINWLAGMNWQATDADGSVWQYENEPYVLDHEVWGCFRGEVRLVDDVPPPADFTQTLIRREPDQE